MKVELIYFDGCPNIADTRALLVKAFVKLKLPITWTEWNQNDEDCPQELSQFGSPTVLVNGVDVLPLESVQQGDCCRVYFDEDSRKSSGTPTLNMLTTAMEDATQKIQIDINESTKPKWIAFFAAIPSVLIAFLPKLTCPMCWPSYTALLTSFGINFANYTPYLPVIIVSLLMVSLISIGYKAKSRRGYNPLWLGVVASLGIITGQIIWDSKIVFFSGSTLLIIAAIWNAWPNKKACCQTKVKSCCSTK